MPFLGVAGIGGLVAFMKPGTKPTVFGGNLSEDSTYYYRSFLGNGSLTVTGGVLTADVLTIAGGGAAGYDWAAGGGAGAVLHHASRSLTPTAHSILVGAGGAGVLAEALRGANGSNSQFGSFNSALGGGGGGGLNVPGTAGTGGDGGSGGGGNQGLNAGGARAGGASTQTLGDATAKYGFSGGSGFSSGANTEGSGGGGGAGGVGGNGSSAQGGAGGVGTTVFSSWGLATGTGQNVAGTVYYAGGGGGSGRTSGIGGYGGGGTAQSGGANGAPNTGGGGGQDGKSGGSGVVIVRYLKTAVKESTDAYELIGTIRLSATQSQLVFAGIPQQYKHLQLRMTSRTDRSASATADVFVRVNGDSGANYGYHQLYGYNNSAASGATASSTDGLYLGSTAGATSVSGAFGTLVMDLLDFASITKNKTSRCVAGTIGTSATTGIIGINSSLWRSTAAVTSLTVYCNQGNFVSGTRASLYGLRG